jgi:hypothetical protein
MHLKIRSAVISIVLSIATVLIWADSLGQNSDSNCDTEAFMTSSGKMVMVTAEKVSVNPKFGRHQVFGVFIIPASIPKWTPALLTVEGVGIYCSRVQRYGPAYENIVAPSGSIVMLDFVRTRTAISLFFQGKIAKLRDRKNWRYTYKLNS